MLYFWPVDGRLRRGNAYRTRRFDGVSDQVFQGGLVMANKWVKIAVHYATTFAVGAIATWIFQWTAVEWLVYFVFCDLWYILRETRDSDD